jgi:membrane-bound inhibitor of C-type lysozyme
MTIICLAAARASGYARCIITTSGAGMRAWLAVAALAGLASACADLPPKTEEQLAGRQVRYVCPDGTQIVAEYAADMRTVRLTLPDRQVILQRRAATDALVRFGDGTTAFGTSGAEAAVADQIRIIHSGCVAR